MTTSSHDRNILLNALPSPADRRFASVSLASVVAAGCFYLVAVPQPDADTKLGATRPSAVSTQIAVGVSKDSAIKVIGAAPDTRKSCDEQTWPYIEPRCLTVADNKPRQDKSNVAAPSIRNILTGVKPPRIDESSIVATTEQATEQPVGSVTAMAPTPAIKEMQANTAGVASNDIAGGPDASVVGVARAGEFGIPLPQPRPDLTLTNLSAPDDADEVESDFVAPPLSRAEQRRMERDEWRMRRAERRAYENQNRIVRRWSEYGRDPRLDRFFRNFR